MASTDEAAMTNPRSGTGDTYTPTNLMKRDELAARLLSYLDCCLYMTDRGKLRNMQALMLRLNEAIMLHVEWNDD